MDIQWPLAVFTLLTGLAGWTFFFVGLNEFTKKSKQDGFVVGIASIVLLAIGSLASVLHLSHPDRIMNALSHPTSGIFTEFVLVMLLGVPFSRTCVPEARMEGCREGVRGVGHGVRRADLVHGRVLVHHGRS